MNSSVKRTGLISAVVALAAVAGCSNKQRQVDPSLKADLAAVGGTGSDLQLAPSSAKSSMVVSAIEGGPESAPKQAAPVHTARPVQHKAPPAAADNAVPVNAPSPSPVATSTPTPATQVEQQPAIQAPAPMPTPAPRQDHRVYKTEGEIFRQMPWIRP